MNLLMMSLIGELMMIFKVGDIIRQKGIFNNVTHYVIQECTDTHVMRMSRVRATDIEYPYIGPYPFKMFELVEPPKTKLEYLHDKIAFLEKKAEKLKSATSSKQVDVPSVAPTAGIVQGTTSRSTAMGTHTVSHADMAVLEAWYRNYMTQMSESGILTGSHQLTNWTAEEYSGLRSTG